MIACSFLSKHLSHIARIHNLVQKPDTLWILYLLFLVGKKRNWIEMLSYEENDQKIVIGLQSQTIFPASNRYSAAFF
jgi:hypothetical protein